MSNLMKPDFETRHPTAALDTFLNSSCEAASANELEDILQNCVVRNIGLQNLVDSVVNTPDLWRETLKSSYRHANGFHKIVLLQGHNFKLRLHHFVPTSTLPPAEHIHDHRWPFASHIVKGNLCMDLFELAGTNDGFPTHAFLYDSAKDDGGFTATYEGLQDVSHLKNVTYEQGTTYHMQPEEMHRIIANTEPCTTLMLTGKPISTFCHFYAQTEPTFEQTRTIPYTPAELNSILNDILKNQNSDFN